jgi:hypothetical protein
MTKKSGPDDSPMSVGRKDILRKWNEIRFSGPRNVLVPGRYFECH